MDKNTAYMLGKVFKLGMIYAQGKAHKDRTLALDEAKWITVHPNGKENKGRPALLDGETGEVLGGMGGKFNGKHISAVPEHGKHEQMGAQMRVNAKNHKADLMNGQKIDFIKNKQLENNQPAGNNQKAMTEQEYLASKGVGGAFSDYMLDKVRTNPNRTERAKKRFNKEADKARNDYFDKREQARKEYQEKISNGELRNKTTLEQRLEKAQGHEDNASTQSARRLLEKQGIDWRTGKALNAKGEETLKKYNQTVNNQSTENQITNKQNKKISFNGYDFENVSEAKDFLYDAEKNIRGHKEDIVTNTAKLKQANKDLAKLQTLDRFYQDYKKDNPLFEKSFTEYLKDNKANYRGIKANELPDLRASKYWGGGYQDSERAINTLKNAYERVSDNLKRKNTEIRDLNRDIEYARERIPHLQKLIKIGNETISKLEK